MTARRDGLPLAIWGIGFGIFAQGTSELMLAGLLPEMATDLGVTIPQAGWLISAFALGMFVGAPILAVLTLRWPRRFALLGTFSHLAAMLLETTGLDSAWVSTVLFGYGFGALIGIAIGGKAADPFPRAVLGIGFVGLLIASLCLHTRPLRRSCSWSRSGCWASAPTRH